MTELQDRLRDLADTADRPVDAHALAIGARRRAARARRRSVVASALAVTAALAVVGTLLTPDRPDPAQPAVPSPTHREVPTTRQALCSARPDLPVLEEAATAVGTDGEPTTPLSDLILCPADLDDPVWRGLPDVVLTGEFVSQVTFDFSGPPVERCGDSMPAAPGFALVGVRADDGTAWQVPRTGGCRGWHQINSYFVALAQQELASGAEDDVGGPCSPLTPADVYGGGTVFTGTYSAVTLCVHPWWTWVVDQTPTYRPVQGYVLDGAELRSVAEELRQIETVGPRPFADCPYASAVVQVRAVRSSGEQDIRELTCSVPTYSDDGEQVTWPAFPTATQQTLEEALRDTGR